MSNGEWKAPDGTTHESKEAATRHTLKPELEALFIECSPGGSFDLEHFIARMERQPLRAIVQEYLDTYGREPGRTLNQSEEG